MRVENVEEGFNSDDLIPYCYIHSSWHLDRYLYVLMNDTIMSTRPSPFRLLHNPALLNYLVIDGLDLHRRLQWLARLPMY